MRTNYPKYWEELRNLYNETNSIFFKYGFSLAEIERKMDAIEFNERMHFKIDFNES